MTEATKKDASATVKEEEPPSGAAAAETERPPAKSEQAPAEEAPPKREYQHELLRFLDENKAKISPLLILIHDFPDPDAIAGGCALEYLAEKAFGIQCRVVYGGIIGRTENRNMVSLLKLPIHKVRPSDFKKFPNIALVDTQPAFENNSFPKRKKKSTIIIDQHTSETPPEADLAIIEPNCGAACAIVARALLESGIEIPVKIGTALAYGILTDTFNFSRAKGTEVVKTYLDILPSCDMKKLAQIQNPLRNRHFFNVVGRAIYRAKTHRGLVVAHLGEVKTPDLVSLAADFLLSYRRAKRSFCTGRYKGKLHFSLRLSRYGTSAGTLLREVVDDEKNAGGHGLIAGGSVKIGEGTSEEVWEAKEQELTLRLLKRLRIPTTREPYYPFRGKNQ